MDGAIIGAVSGGSVMIILNLTFFAYGYGKMSQKVDDLCSRLKRVEDKVDKINGGKDAV